MEIYHVFNKSIAGYKIFNSPEDFRRMTDALSYYRRKQTASFSTSAKCTALAGKASENLVNIIAYCLMPTHFHLILHNLADNGIAHYTNNVLNSYTRYFNLKHNRKGPLWQGRSKKVLIAKDVYLLHLTRYIHLNPVTGYLVEKPEEWEFSSYREYTESRENGICDRSFLSMGPREYENFTNDRIQYQRELKKIKNLILE